MAVVRVAAAQAAYRLMDRDGTIERAAELTADAAARGAQLVVFPEVFVPGTPLWIDTQPVWEDDEKWFGLLATNAVVIPSPATDRLGEVAEQNSVWLAIGVEERDPHGGTIYNTLLYFSPKATWSTSTASSCRPARSAPCGAWATAQPCGSSTWSSDESAG